ncbi:MAG: BMC domain-containing protein [Acidaminococcales bacterium]|nr:BMC domain-containing protein [Acidaminococcales bacterium]
MPGNAMGFIETVGYAGALVAADFALKNANVRLVKMERVIGANKLLSLTVWLEGEVAAVQSAVASGKTALEQNGMFARAHVIPNMDAGARALFK